MKKSQITLALALSCAFSAPAMANWSADALNHQYRLQKHEPIVHGLIVGTHNSYSSKDYNLKIATNQHETITEQLNAGSRILEFDMYRTRDVEYGGIYLCHNEYRCVRSQVMLGDYVYLDTMLREIATWTKANPDQIIIIKIENGNMKDEDFGVLEEGLSLQLGDIVYRPERNGVNDGCKSFPSTLTPAQMLEKGKQVLFFGFTGCDAKKGAIGVTNKWIFSNTNNETDKADVMASAAQSCERHGDDKFSLYYEGREDIFGTGQPTSGKISESLITDLPKCGGTAFAFDWLIEDDNRMKTAVWSWGENQPDGIGPTSTNNVSCAVSHQDRFYDDDCGLQFAFACENDLNQWKITTTTGSWDKGEASCQSEFGNAYHFSVPATSKQNQAVKSANTNASNYWMNYHKGKGSQWLSGKDIAYQTTQTDKSDRLKVAVATDYTFVYSDTGTGGGLNMGIYRAKLPGDGWYLLGDTPAFAADGFFASGYSRTPGRSLIVFDDGSDKLADPIRYDWKWNDWKTDGDQDVTFWHPVGPTGYTCLGDAVRLSHDRSQPVLPIKCVRDDLLMDGEAHYYWNDNGTGGEYDGLAYLTIAANNLNVNQAAAASTTRLSGGTSHKVLDFNKVNVVNGAKSIVDKAFTEIKALDKCIEPNTDSFTNGVNVQLWACNNSDRQQWLYEPATGFIRNKHNTNYCLDSTGAGAALTSVKIHACVDHINLKWSWNGTRIKPQANSALSLDVFYGNSANGTDIIQFTDNNTVAQIFSKGL